MQINVLIINSFEIGPLSVQLGRLSQYFFHLRTFFIYIIGIHLKSRFRIIQHVNFDRYFTHIFKEVMLCSTYL